MAVATFDTLKFANTLKAAGVPDKQAEAEAAAFAEVMQINFRELVTKADLDQAVKDLRRDTSDLRTELKREVVDFRQEVTTKLKDLDTKFDLRMKEVELRFAKIQGEMALLRWMMGILITGVTGLLIRILFFKM